MYVELNVRNNGRNESLSSRPFFIELIFSSFAPEWTSGWSNKFKIYCTRISVDACRVYQNTYPEVIYRGADKSLARPGRKQATATKDLEFHMFYL